MGKSNEEINKKNKLWRKRNPIKWKEIHKKQQLKESSEKKNAWKNDYLKRESNCCLCGRESNCCLCGSKKKLEFHHINYEHHVGITVCFNCHRYKIHNEKGGKTRWD